MPFYEQLCEKTLFAVSLRRAAARSQHLVYVCLIGAQHGRFLGIITDSLCLCAGERRRARRLVGRQVAFHLKFSAVQHTEIAEHIHMPFRL